MTIPAEAVFLLTSADPNKKNAFATAFAVARKENDLVLLTCAHVLDEKHLGPKVKVGEHEAAIMGELHSGTIDLILLRIPCVKDTPLINRVVKGTPNKKFLVLGYGDFSGAKNTYVLREIEGELGKSIGLESSESDSRAEAWDLHIKDDDFSRLQYGYSGSPICDTEGGLIAVASHRVGDGLQGHAFGIANLQTIYPDIEQLIPSFPFLTTNGRLRQAKERLLHRVADIVEVIHIIHSQLERMEQEGIRGQDEITLRMVEQFLDHFIASQDFIKYCQEISNSSQTHRDAGPDYNVLARRLRKGHITLCLGQELSHLLGTPIPSTEQIIGGLAGTERFYGPLSEICEQRVTLPNCGRFELIEDIRGLVCRPVAQPAPVTLHNLLANLEKPLLVISTAYDVLLEDCLRDMQKKFVLISQNTQEKNNRLFLNYSDRKDTFFCSSDELSHEKPLEEGYIVIYKLRGDVSDKQRENLLLTEQDYLDFIQATHQWFPDYIRIKLKNHPVWFLGHHPTSWEERLLIKTIQKIRGRREQALAIQKNMSIFCQAFWRANNVYEYDLDPADFIQQLSG